jgi:hypothetical protein
MHNDIYLFVMLQFDASNIKELSERYDFYWSIV